MRKTVFLICLFSVFIQGIVQAQEPKQEISLGYGLSPTSEFIDFFSDLTFFMVSLAQYEKRNYSTFGTLTLGYRYQLNKRWSIGAAAGYSASSGEIWLFGQRTGDVHVRYYTLAAEADFRYINKAKLKLYSSAGLGLTYRDERYRPSVSTESPSKHNDMLFDFQITALGIKYGARAGFFGSVGFGYRGLAQAGLFVRL